MNALSPAEELRAITWDARVAPALVRSVQPFVRFLSRRHGVRVEGLEHLPEGPALLVGNHGLFGYESPFFFEHLFSQLGRLPIGLADRAFFRLPVVRDLLVRLGGAYGCMRNALGAFERRELVVCYPGGARETMKRHSERYRCLWEDRLGFVRLAILGGVPIVPFAAAGVDDTYEIVAHLPGAGGFVLGHGSAGLPIGWGHGPLPRRVPFWFRLGAPMTPPPELRATDEEGVRRMHESVWKHTQGMLDALVVEWQTNAQRGEQHIA